MFSAVSVVVNSKQGTKSLQYFPKWKRNQNGNNNRGEFQRRGFERRDRRGGKSSYRNQDRSDIRQDEALMAQRLDADLASYTQQRDVLTQPIDSVTQTPGSIQ